MQKLHVFREVEDDAAQQVMQIGVSSLEVQISLHDLDNDRQNQTANRHFFEAEVFDPIHVVQSVRAKCLYESCIFSQN